MTTMMMMMMPQSSGGGEVMLEDKEVGGWKKTPTEHRPNLSRI